MNVPCVSQPDRYARYLIVRFLLGNRTPVLPEQRYLDVSSLAFVNDTKTFLSRS